LELVLLAEGITVSLRSHFVLERVKNSLSCLGSHPNFSGNPPTGRSHPPVVGPLLFQLLLLCQLDGVKSLARHPLPVLSGLDVLVHGLLHVTDSDVELTHLLSEGGPTR
jgi:hypothetical protein